MVMKVAALCSWSHGRWIQWERWDTCSVCNCNWELCFKYWCEQSVRIEQIIWDHDRELRTCVVNNGYVEVIVWFRMDNLRVNLQKLSYVSTVHDICCFIIDSFDQSYQKFEDYCLRRMYCWQLACLAKVDQNWGLLIYIWHI